MIKDYQKITIIVMTMKIKKLHNANAWDLFVRNSLSSALTRRIKKSL
jgi:hypothetical protein